MDIVGRGCTPILKHWRPLLVCISIIVCTPILFQDLLPKVHATTSGIWQQYTYNGSAGSRPYFVYTPANYQLGTIVPMIVMLHGCTQTPADFAAGTQMDQLADQKQFIVVYPQQTSTYNQEDCWNWFDPADCLCGRSFCWCGDGCTSRSHVSRYLCSHWRSVRVGV